MKFQFQACERTSLRVFAEKQRHEASGGAEWLADEERESHCCVVQGSSARCKASTALNAYNTFLSLAYKQCRAGAIDCDAIDSRSLAHCSCSCERSWFFLVFLWFDPRASRCRESETTNFSTMFCHIDYFVQGQLIKQKPQSQQKQLQKFRIQSQKGRKHIFLAVQSELHKSMLSREPWMERAT